MELVYKNEKSLFVISLVIGILVWLALLVGTVGLALIYVALVFLLYLFAQSGFISHLRGNAVELNPEQFPELHRQYMECCTELDVKDVPRAYLMMSDGVLNALATKFLRRHYVVLFSSVVDALKSKPGALKFYFGHELAHVKRGHLNLRWLLFPASIVPLLGAAYRRAQEYTCDLHGLRASNSTDDALAALVVLGTGGELLPRVNVDRFVRQQEESGGFWMSFHELTNDYPWLCKRVSHLAGRAAAGEASRQPPSRSFWAGLVALFVPRVGVPGGGGASALIMIVIIGVLAAIAIPAYQDYTIRLEVTQALNSAVPARDATMAFVQDKEAYPESLEALGVTTEFESGSLARLGLGEEGGLVLTLRSSKPSVDGRTIEYVAYRAEDGTIQWDCTGGTLEPKYRPQACRPTR